MRARNTHARVRRFDRAVLLASLLGAALLAESAVAQDEENESYVEADEPTPNEEAASASTEPSVAAPRSDLSFYGGVRLGLGGSAHYDPGGNDDLVASFDLHGGADYLLSALSPYLAIGGELRIGSFNTDFHDERGDDRGWAIDLAVRPRARFALNDAMELYATLPFGPSYIALPDTWNAESGFGFNLGAGGGLMYLLRDNLGLGGEFSYLMHWFSLESQVVGVDGTPVGEASVRLGQANFTFNVWFLY